MDDINDELEQAFRQGKMLNKNVILKSAYKELAKTHPKTYEYITTHKCTTDKTTKDLLSICEKFLGIGIHPGLEHLRYIKLAMLEAELEGDINEPERDLGNNDQ